MPTDPRDTTGTGYTGAKGITDAEYINAIHEARGMLSTAADRLGVTRKAVYDAVHRSADVAQALDRGTERTKDFAESALYLRMGRGDVAAIIFYLKTQAKDRGYIERQQVEHSGTMEQLLRRLPDMPDDELDALAREHGLNSRD